MLRKEIAAAALMYLFAVPSGAMTTLELMKGAGEFIRDQGGKTTFRYAVNIHAYDSLNLSEDDLRKQHQWLIGSFLAEGGYCPKGYEITRATIEKAADSYLYEGTCR